MKQKNNKKCISERAMDALLERPDVLVSGLIRLLQIKYDLLMSLFLNKV